MKTVQNRTKWMTIIWESIHKIKKFFKYGIKVILQLLFGLICILGILNFLSSTPQREGNGETPTQIWNLEEKLQSKMINLNQKDGSTVWLGFTVKKEEAIQIARRRRDLFNKKVEDEYDDYAHNFITKVDDHLVNKVKLFFVQDVKGKCGIYIVPQKKKVLDDEGKPLSDDSGMIYEVIR